MNERFCEFCDEQISPRRLAVMPNAVTCVECVSAGFVPDVFMYRSKLEQDSMGNIHVEIVHDEHEWECIQRNNETERGDQ